MLVYDVIIELGACVAVFSNNTDSIFTANFNFFKVGESLLFDRFLIYISVTIANVDGS
jgi:hypothetical protein